MGAASSLHVLYIDDDLGDVELAQMAISDIGWSEARLSIIEDGDSAVAYLKESGSKNPIPDLILLDLNLPKLHGFEVLKFIRSRDALKSVPIIIISTSNAEKDSKQAKTLGANGYFTKPSGYESYKDMFRKIQGNLGHQAFAPL